MDLYGVLGVPKDASVDVIRKAYHRLAIKYHPDKNDGHDAEERFKEVQRAYEVLSDPKMRQRYDMTGSVEHSGPMFRQRFDLVVEVTYEELMYGCTRSVKLSEEIIVDPSGKRVTPSMCRSCGGKGRLLGMFGYMCVHCDNRGVVYPPDSVRKSVVNTLEIEVEPKSWPGRTIDLDDKRVILRPAKHERLHNNRATLIYTYPITIFHAMLGLEKDLEVLDLTHHIDHSRPIMPETEIVFPDSGMYLPNGSRGPLIIAFDVQFPEKITEGQKMHLKRCIEIDKKGPTRHSS